MTATTPLLLVTLSLAAAPPATRIAVLLDDPAQAAPARASIEVALQKRGYEVVAPEVSEKMRKTVAPEDLLGARLPEGLSVFEADAIVAGSVSYGDPQDVEGVRSAAVSLTARLVDLGTGRTTTTIQTAGVGIGIQGPELLTRGAAQAVDRLFEDARFKAALADLGQEAGMVTLIVQQIPNREALLEVQRGLEQVLAGAPIREVYFARGLGKLTLGGSKSKSMIGPDIANVIGDNSRLALEVTEVANTRIVATFSRAHAVRIHALILEPKVPAAMRTRSEELGKYVATRFATFKFAKATFQPGKLTKEQVKSRAQRVAADVVVESEIYGRGHDAALVIRVLDAKTGQPIYRDQQLIATEKGEMGAAEKMLESIAEKLPDHLTVAQAAPTSTAPSAETAKKD